MAQKRRKFSREFKSRPCGRRPPVIRSQLGVRADMLHKWERVMLTRFCGEVVDIERQPMRRS